MVILFSRGWVILAASVVRSLTSEEEDVGSRQSTIYSNRSTTYSSTVRIHRLQEEVERPRESRRAATAGAGTPMRPNRQDHHRLRPQQPKSRKPTKTPRKDQVSWEQVVKGGGSLMLPTRGQGDRTLEGPSTHWGDASTSPANSSTSATDI